MCQSCSLPCSFRVHITITVLPSLSGREHLCPVVLLCHSLLLFCVSCCLSPRQPALAFPSRVVRDRHGLGVFPSRSAQPCLKFGERRVPLAQRRGVRFATFFVEPLAHLLILRVSAARRPICHNLHR